MREGFDCVLRVGALGDSSLVARPLDVFRVANLASPAYLRAYGTPPRVEDLAAHRLIHYVTTLGARPDGFEYWDGAAFRVRPMTGTITVNNAGAYEAACLAGLGLIQAPVAGLHKLLEQGLLREVLPELRAEPMPVSLRYAHHRHLPRRVQAFMDWMAETLRLHVDPP